MVYYKYPDSGYFKRKAGNILWQFAETADSKVRTVFRSVRDTAIE